MFKKKFPVSVYVGIVLGAVSIVYSVINMDILFAVVVAVLWAFSLFSVIKWDMIAKYALYLLILVLGITITLNVFIPKDVKDNAEDEADTSDEYVEDDTVYPDGTVYIEGESGTLTNAGSYSFLGETTIGNQAYIGDGGATVTYTFNIETSGTYLLSVRLSDDDLHDDGARSADILIDNSISFKYTHVSEDTNGWKWYEIGDVTLEEGEHIIVFTKIQTTTAAYTMDAFRLVPEE